MKGKQFVSGGRNARGEGLQATPPFSPRRQRVRERFLAGYCAANPEDEAKERTNPYYIPILHEVLRFAIIFKAWTVKCNVAIRIS